MSDEQENILEFDILPEVFESEGEYPYPDVDDYEEDYLEGLGGFESGGITMFDDEPFLPDEYFDPKPSKLSKLVARCRQIIHRSKKEAKGHEYTL